MSCLFEIERRSRRRNVLLLLLSIGDDLFAFIIMERESLCATTEEANLARIA